MHTAQITSWGDKPSYISVPDLPAPGPDEVQIKVEAVGIHRVVRSRASGQHYSSGSLPHIPGIDGVGTTTAGEKVYFSTFAQGVMAQYVNLPKTNVCAFPAGADPVQVAASINPAMSSWMALRSRTANVPKGFTCLILGVTSASGRVAISIARAYGAKTIIGAARSRKSLESLDLDGRIVIGEEPGETDFSGLDDVDVVLDYVYGPLAVHLLGSLKTPKPVQYVHIGALSGQGDVVLPGALLRSKDITIRGAGPGAWNMRDFAKSLPQLLEVVKGMPEQAVKVAKFEDVEKEWEFSGPERLVFVP